MATAWKNEQWLYYRGGQGNYDYWGNLGIDSVTRNGSNVTVSGYIRFTAKGLSGYGSSYNWGVTATPTNGSTVTILNNNETIYNGTNKDVWFSTTLTNVAAGATSANISVTYTAWYNQTHTSTYWSETKTWSVSFPASGSAPSGGYVNSLTATWNSVTGTYGITSDGGSTLTKLIFKVLKAPYVAFVPAREYRATNPGNMSLNPRTKTVDNSSDTENNPTWTFKGCDLYYAGIYASNSIGEYRYQDGSVYSPPAPGQLSYQEPESGNIYTVNYVGVPANNNPDYDPSWLTRTVRYKVGSGDWTYIENDTVVALDTTTTSTITIPASSSAVVEAWMVYHGAQSEVSSVTIVNNNSPVNLYGSVNDETALITKLYGSVNGESVKIEKLYASVEGVARKVFEDV